MPQTSTKRRAARKSRSRRGRSSSRRRASRRQARGRRTSRLPGWGDLMGRSGGSALEQVSTARFAGLLVVVAAVLAFYVGHVHATQDLLVQVQQARQENQRLHLKHNRLRGAFDRATGPSVIYERAPALGLEEHLPQGPTIIIED